MNYWNLFGLWLTFIGTITSVVIANDNVSWQYLLLMFINSIGFILFLNQFVKTSLNEGGKNG